MNESPIPTLVVCVCFILLFGIKFYACFGLLSFILLYLADNESFEKVKGQLNVEDAKNWHMYINYILFWPIFILTHMLLRDKEIDKQE